MHKNKILVTGGSGMVGKYLKNLLPDATYLSSKEYDLRNQSEANALFKYYKPDIIIHLASIVGGILDNINKSAEYFDDNILINTNTLYYAKKYNVKRFIAILSTCIYPDTVEAYPLTEEMLHMGAPTESNFSYGYAKRCMAVQIGAYNKQYGTNYQYLIPSNLYGEFDNYKNENKMHFVTSLIKKIMLAKKNNLNYVTLFGTGSPLRQFMYAGDLALIIKKCIDNNINDNFNVVPDENLSIFEIAEIALKACNAEHLKISFDISKPDGQHRKDASNKKFRKYFPDFQFTKLKEGIKTTYDFLIKNNIIE